jgi:hypothetical protein
MFGEFTAVAISTTTWGFSSARPQRICAWAVYPAMIWAGGVPAVSVTVGFLCNRRPDRC